MFSSIPSLCLSFEMDLPLVEITQGIVTLLPSQHLKGYLASLVILKETLNQRKFYSRGEELSQIKQHTRNAKLKGNCIWDKTSINVKIWRSQFVRVISQTLKIDKEGNSNWISLYIPYKGVTQSGSNVNCAFMLYTCEHVKNMKGFLHDQPRVPIGFGSWANLNPRRLL